MIELIFFLICFGASTLGAICGIGGGVIIKPVLDAFGILDVTAISFLSGCTVLAMASYSVASGRLDRKRSGFSSPVKPLLAAGAAAGGVIGKWLFGAVKAMSDGNRVGAVQAACLLLVTAATLVYTISKQKIRVHHITNRTACVVIGLALGLISSFLGIGGGPINLFVLSFFFGMETKAAADASLYVILFSQIMSLCSSLATGSVPSFPLPVLFVMLSGGILGGVIGRAVNKKIHSDTVEKLFLAAMVVIILINIYNIFKLV